jgi:hypothetical protein
MAFPLTPTDGEFYTNTLGTVYRYDSTRTAWLISTTGAASPSFNSVTITGNVDGTSNTVAPIRYGTGDPPATAGIPFGTIYIQYVT